MLAFRARRRLLVVVWARREGQSATAISKGGARGRLRNRSRCVAGSVQGGGLHTELARLEDGGAEDVPCLEEPGFGLVPVARVQQALDVGGVVAADGDNAGQLARGIEELLRQLVGREARGLLQLPLQPLVGVLDAAGTDGGEQTRVLEGEGAGLGAPLPPDVIEAQEVGRIDDVVVVVDVMDEAVDELL